MTKLSANTFVLSVTKGHSSDRPVLREVLGSFPVIPFLGVIGSNDPAEIAISIAAQLLERRA